MCFDTALVCIALIFLICLIIYPEIPLFLTGLLLSLSLRSLILLQAAYLYNAIPYRMKFIQKEEDPYRFFGHSVFSAFLLLFASVYFVSFFA